MARVPDVLLGCWDARRFSEEDEAEFTCRNEVSFYDSAPHAENVPALKAAGLEHTVALKPDAELPRWGGLGPLRPFSDADQVEMLSSNLVEDPVSFGTAASASAAGRTTYRLARRPVPCYIQDVDQKTFHLAEAQLYAVHANMPDYKPVQLSLHFYRSLDGASDRGQPVALEIVGHKLFLSCEQAGERPQLQLVKMEALLPETFGKEMEKFLFYFCGEGPVSFESVACPGWYIATTQSSGHRVQLRSGSEQQFYQLFLLTTVP